MRIMVGDTETSGLSKKDGICELGFIEINHNLEVIADWHSLIDPECPISPSASGTNGITDADVEFEPTMPEAMKILEEKFGLFEQILLVAHNAPFDCRFLAPYWGITNTLCTVNLARKVFPDAPDHRLMTLRFYLNLEVDMKGIEGAHRAMGDTMVLFALLKRLIEESGYDLYELLGYAARPAKVTHMTFGEHKGKKLEDIPAKYRKWLLTLGNLEDGIRIALNNLQGGGNA